MIEKDTVSGSFPVQIWQDIIESQKVTDVSNKRSSVNVSVILRTHSPSYEFILRDTLTADEAIISDVSNADFPRNTTELIPRTIGKYIEKESTFLEELNQNRGKKINKRAKIRTAIGVGLGLLTGSVATATGILVAKNDYETALTGGLPLTLIFGTLALYTALGDFNESNTPDINSSIENTKDRLALLELIQAASRNLKIKNLDIKQTPEE